MAGASLLRVAAAGSTRCSGDVRRVRGVPGVYGVYTGCVYGVCTRVYLGNKPFTAFYTAFTPFTPLLRLLLHRSSVLRMFPVLPHVPAFLPRVSVTACVCYRVSLLPRASVTACFLLLLFNS